MDDKITKAAWVRAFRSDAATAQKGRCYYCGEPLTSENISADHAIPQARGGKDERANILAACIPCNITKGNGTAAWFLAKIKRQPEPGEPIHMWMAWSRRRIWMATHRATRHIAQAVGMQT